MSKIIYTRLNVEFTTFIQSMTRAYNDKDNENNVTACELSTHCGSQSHQMFITSFYLESMRNRIL